MQKYITYWTNVYSAVICDSKCDVNTMMETTGATVSSFIVLFVREQLVVWNMVLEPCLLNCMSV